MLFYIFSLLLMSLFVNTNVYTQQKADSDIVRQESTDIVLNPYGTTPLSAAYKLEKVNKDPIFITVRGKRSEYSVFHEFPERYGKEIPIHGLYANHENIVTIKHGENPARIFYIKTPPLKIFSSGNTPLKLEAKIKTDVLETACISNQDLYFVSIPNNNMIAGYDRTGEIRYVYKGEDSGSKIYVMRMERDEKQVFFRMIDDNKFYQTMDLLGKPITRHKLRVHHEAVPYSSDCELILANSKWGWEDSVWIINTNPPRDPDRPKRKPNAQIVNKLLIGDAIRKVVKPQDLPILNQVIYDDNNVYEYVNPKATNNNAKPKKVRIDWAHANSLVYDKVNDRLYISLRHQGIIAIKMSTWTLQWFMTDEKLKIQAGTKYGEKPKESKYLIDVPSLKPYRMNTTMFNGNPKGAHSLLLKKNGNLLLFDNQADELKNPGGSRVIEYNIDERNMIARVIKQFNTIDFTYSRLVSDVDISGDFHENRLILFGNSTPKRIMEVGVNNNILFDMIINTPAIFYRVDKYPLYPYSGFGKKYSIDNNELLEADS
ncbi:MAG: aryl-sulfate sulfotransferase [Brevinemataceae bacterium]